MTDPHDRLGVARPEGGFWWLKGRAGRREYWAYVAALFVLSFILSRPAPVVDLVLTILMAFVQARRLHDFDRSGWWALLAQLGPLVVIVPLIVLGLEEPALVIGVGLELAAIGWIGAIPGTPGDNRFGPTPPFSAQRLLTGR